MKKANRKFVIALVMLLISAITLSTASYAWFSMNQTVTATGMTVTAKVSSNLLIAGTTIDATAKEGEDEFLNALTQTQTGLLEPVSTVDGVNFFYTSGTNVKANGDAISNTYLAYNPASTGDFNTAYNTTGAVGYIDYVFQLKAMNTDTVNPADINLTKLELKYAGTADASKAYRVAVFSEKFATAFTASATGLKNIYTEAGAANHTDGDAVSSVSALSDVTYNGTTAIASVAAGATEYYKVVVRLYLEGEDTTCTNETFLALTQAWALDIELQLGTGTQVANLTKTVTP